MIQAPRRKSARRYRYWDDAAWFGDQGDLPHCVGYAWAHWLHGAPLCQYLDPSGIYYAAQHVDEWEGTDYDGTSVRAGAKILKSLGFIAEYRWARTVDALVQTVLEIGPVVMGTDWYSGMSAPRGSVLYPAGRYEGGHAWLITGCNVDRELFRMKNSWSRDWAAAGRGWISFADVAKLLAADGEACLAVERRAAA